MKLPLLFILLIFSNQVFADFIFTPGACLSVPFSSEEKNSSKSNIIEANAGIGLQANLDWIVFGPLTLGLGLGYQARSAEVQYQNAIATANDLSASMVQFSGDVGTKLRIINFRRFKMYLGAGLNIGSLSMSFDEKDFKTTTGSKDGFEESESRSYNGRYFDAGIEYIISNTGGLRISAKQTDIETAKFVNLNNERL